MSFKKDQRAALYFTMSDIVHATNKNLVASKLSIAAGHQANQLPQFLHELKNVNKCRFGICKLFNKFGNLLSKTIGAASNSENKQTFMRQISFSRIRIEMRTANIQTRFNLNRHFCQFNMAGRTLIILRTKSRKTSDGI